MDEDFFHKLVIGLLIVIIIMCYMNITGLNSTKGVIADGMKCNEVVDKIYEQCKEETTINIGTLKGRNTTLHYENGVCIIK